MQISFQDGLPFLQNFVDNARINGAREYKKIVGLENIEQEFRLAPYATQQAASSFETFLKE